MYGTPISSGGCPRRPSTSPGGRRPRCPAALGERGIFVWDGNYYALELMQRLGLEGSGGAVRVGAVHYNTAAEIDPFLEAVADLA